MLLVHPTKTAKSFKRRFWRLEYMSLIVRNNRTVRFISAVILLSMSVGLSTRQGFAWGDEGHKIVAHVAEHYLTDTSRQRILQLLKEDQKKDYYSRECPQAQSVGDYMACVASWADRVRPDRPETALWHYVDIPNHPKPGTSATYDPVRDCPPTRDGDCVILAVEQFKAMLMKPEAAGGRDKQRRIEAVKFIIHFVGDLHQPLHSADNDDKGGNDVKVFWLGNEFSNGEKRYEWNLHSVWDSGIVSKTNPSADESVARLLAALANVDIKAMQKGTVVDWANEAHVIALKSVYNDKFLTKKIKGADGTLKVDLGQEYYNSGKDIVDLQLERAGVRLARVLNELFGA
jgi:S1/P1 Nuclease